jgi:UDP-galactopyranose mutase
LWGVRTPEEARRKIDEQRTAYAHIKHPQNLEEQALVLTGTEIYEKLIKGYTEKQWGRPATELPAFIISRIPLRFTFDNNYFTDLYQGIPIGGYTSLINSLLKGIEVKLNVNYFERKNEFDELAEKIVYTGQVDEYFDFKFGKLEYRSLHFEHEILDIQNYQGNAGVNYTAFEVPYTRIIEHKHFEYGIQEKTCITREYPHEYSVEKQPFYPINDSKNQAVLQKYLGLEKGYQNVLFGGRLAEYKYYDMHQIIAKVLELTKNI